MLVKDNNPDIKMETFQVYISGDSFLYANGRQQVKVTVKARKHVKGSDGYWVSQSLTQQEKDSVTLQTLNGHNSAQSVGISVTHQSAGYEFGQWPKQKEGSQEKAIEREDAFDYIDVYVSTSKTESQQMVGFINLEGSENFWNSDELGATNTIVSITGKPVYSITAEQMILDLDQAYSYQWHKGHYTDVNIYNWQLPSGLTYKSLTLEDVEAYGGGQNGFFYTRCKDPQILHCRLIASGVNSLTVYQTLGRGLEGYLESADSPNANLSTFSQGNSKLIATRHSTDIAVNISTRNTGGGIFNFIDAYGCQHKLRAVADDSGNTISLHNL